MSGRNFSTEIKWGNPTSRGFPNILKFRRDFDPSRHLNVKANIKNQRARFRTGLLAGATKMIPKKLQLSKPLKDSFLISWMTAVECCRIFKQMAEEAAKTDVFQGSKFYDDLMANVEMMTFNLHFFYRFGPIDKFYPVEILPLAFSVLSSEEKVKQRCREFQQELIQDNCDYFKLMTQFVGS